MKDLNFDSGVVTYSLNGKCEVSFNPSDSQFAERLYSIFDELDKEQEHHKELVEKASGTKEIFKIARETDAEMRKKIDGLFCAPVCEKLFDNVSLCALANGFPLWANLLIAISDEMGNAMDGEQQMSKQRITKYTAKWSKYKK